MKTIFVYRKSTDCATGIPLEQIETAVGKFLPYKKERQYQSGPKEFKTPKDLTTADGRLIKTNPQTAIAATSFYKLK